jgi:AI-2 transport protein TqsA
MTEETVRPTPASLLPTGAAFLAVAAVLALAFGFLREVSSIAAPVFLALTLVLSADPLRRRMLRAGVPTWLATVAVLLLVYAVLLGVLVAIGAALTQLVTVLPDYEDQFRDLYDQGVDLLARFGVELGTVDSVVGGIEPGSVVPFIQGLLTGIGSIGTMVLFIALGIAFLTLDLSDAGTRLAAVRRVRPHLAASLRDFAGRIGHYWLVSTLFGFAQGCANVVLLFVLGVPLPFVWGLLAWVTAYIPNVGFVLGLIPPAILALLEGGPATMLAVVIGYMLISFVLQTLIMPKLMGDAVGLNVTTTFLSLVFWSIVIGPLGALLAVPLTLFAKALLIDSHPRSRWLGTFLVDGGHVDETGPVPDPVPAAAQKPLGGGGGGGGGVGRSPVS